MFSPLRPCLEPSGVVNPVRLPGLRQGVPVSGPSVPFSGPSSPFSGPGVPFFGTGGSFSGTRGPFLGPDGPFFGPRSPFFGPDVPFFGPSCPFSGPSGPCFGTNGPFSETGRLNHKESRHSCREGECEADEKKHRAVASPRTPSARMRCLSVDSWNDGKQKGSKQRDSN
jgi:RNA-binding protein 16